MEASEGMIDTRNKRFADDADKSNSNQKGLNMAKKTNNFKQVAKAEKRLAERNKIESDKRRKERLARRAEQQDKVWNDPNCQLDKKMNRRQQKENKKYEASNRKYERNRIAIKEEELFEEAAKAKSRKNK